MSQQLKPARESGVTGKTYYAIGDVHGMYDMLSRMLREIFVDHSDPSEIVFCGDLVDRGPNSAGVVAEVKKLCEGTGLSVTNFVNGHHTLTVRCVKGNHEDLMVNAYRYRRLGDIMLWDRNGGGATMDSYGGSIDSIPEEHIAWMEALPTRYQPEPDLFFVHGGISPRDWPSLSDDIAMWTRASEFFDSSNLQRWKRVRTTDDKPIMVVHGHTPFISGTAGPRFASKGQRINVDGGAFWSLHGDTRATLTCAKITPERTVEFIEVDAKGNVGRRIPDRG